MSVQSTEYIDNKPIFLWFVSKKTKILVCSVTRNRRNTQFSGYENGRRPTDYYRYCGVPVMNTHYLICINHYSNLVLPVISHTAANLPLIVLYHASVRYLSQPLSTQPVHKLQPQSQQTLTAPRFIIRCRSVDFRSH